MAKIQEWLDMEKKNKQQTLSKTQKQQMTKEDPRTEIAGTARIHRGSCQVCIRKISVRDKTVRSLTKLNCLYASIFRF